MSTQAEMSPGAGEDFRWVGARVARREDPPLLRGQGRYVADIRRPGQLQAAFVRSPVAHATVGAVDVAAAEALPGVVAVLTAADVDHEPLVDAVSIPDLAKTPQPALAGDRVRFVGEPVAIAVADSRHAAEDAVDAVAVDFDARDAVVDARTARGPDAPLLFDELDSNVLYRQRKTYGDAGRAFDGAATVVSAQLDHNRYAAAPIETRGCIAEHEPASDALTMWSSTQSPHLLRQRLARSLGLSDTRIRVVAPDVGGGFGQKIAACPEEIAVALAARALERPVKWIEDRRENLMAAPHAKQQHLQFALALDHDGRFRGMRAEIVGDAGAYSFNNASALIEPYLSAGLMPGVYEIDAYEVEIVAVVTNKSPVSPYRGVGWTAGHTVRELCIDKAARQLGWDPAELRDRNMVAGDAFPYTSRTGMVYDSGSFRESLSDALDQAGYGQLRDRQARLRDQGRYLGIGMSPYVEPTGWGSEGSRQSEWSFASHDAVRVSMEPSGDVTAAVGTPSQGQGHETTLSQVVGEALGCKPSRVTVVNNDTSATPISTSGTRASRTAVVTGGALSRAADDLRERLLRIAGAKLEVSPEDLEITDGRVGVRGDPGAGLDFAQVARAAYFDAGIREQIDDPTLDVTRFHDPRATYSNGSIVAVVEVDVETGHVEVLDVSAVEDCGTVINPAIVEGQVTGAVAQGIGGALLERMAYDDAGQLQTATLMDYLLPTAAEVPNITVGHCSSPSPLTVNGVKGMGESGLIATPAAVANAVADALEPFGVEIESLPLNANTVYELLETTQA